MFRGMYSAATAMDVASRSHEITSHNLAHANVPGYRGRGLVFETFDRALTRAADAPGQPLAGAQVERGFTDFTPGTLQHTGAPLDFALSGNGFFVLQGADGPVYTRNGVFHREPDGRLVNAGGLPVLGQRGPITIPPQASNIVVAEDGTLTIDGARGDRLQLANFSNPGALVPTGITLFRAPPEAGAAASRAMVLQGVREQSNVQLASSMVSLVRDLRYFEASQRALKTLAEASQMITRPS